MAEWTGQPQPHHAAGDAAEEHAGQHPAPRHEGELHEPLPHPQKGLGIGNAPLDEPWEDPAAETGGPPSRPAPRHRGGPAQEPGGPGIRRFNEAGPREGPAWVDRPEEGAGAPAVGRRPRAPEPDEGVPVEEIGPEDLPEVGEPYAQPGAPFDVQGPDRP